MAQKIKPTAHRIGITEPWRSRWFFRKNLSYALEEDCLIREIIRKKIMHGGIASVEIERMGTSNIKVFIKAARPGLIIGRGGKGIEDLRNEIVRRLKSLRNKKKIQDLMSIQINIEELKRGEVSAQVIAEQIASDIGRRLPYRIVIRRQLEGLKQIKEVQGAKIKVAGRLDGAEISRKDWLSFGRIPLQTLRARIDYGEATSFNTYGTVGVKVWIYKGEVFEE